MLENCAIVDTKYYENGSKLIGRKPAKLSTYKTFYPKTKEVMNKLKAVESSSSPVTVPEEKTKEPVNNVAVAAPNTSPVNQVAASAPVTQAPVENVIQFPTKEVLETKLNNMGVICYNDVLPANNILKFESGSVRKLRVGGSVNEKQRYATRTVGTPHEVLETKLNTSESKQEQPKPFDFSNPVNLSNQFEVKEEVQQKDVSSEQTMHVKRDAKLNDYLNGTLSTDNKPSLDHSLPSESDLIDFNEIVRKKEELDKKRATLQQLQQEKEELLNRVENYQQLALKASRKFDEQDEIVDRETFDVTMEIKELQDKIIKFSDLFNDNYEEEDSYNGKSRTA